MKIDLDKYIRELLLRHDCVILPGLGGFIANYRSAEFDASQKTAIPPSRQILFNLNLVHNDGLLYAHISKETGYGYKEVQDMAAVYFKTIKYEIRKGLKFTIDELGYFFLNKAGKIEFTQEVSENLLLDSYGLSYLKYQEFDRIRARNVNFYRTIDEVSPVARQHRIRRWVYTSAAACLVAAMILVPVKMGYLNVSSFDLSPVDSFKKEQPVRELEITGPESDATEFEFEAIGLEAEATGPGSGEQPASLAPAEQGKTFFAAEVSYHIIVGSFKDYDNAQQLKHKMAEEGFEAEILTGENAFYRVSAKQFPQKEAAVTALSSIRNDQAYKSAWILTL